MTTDTSTMTYEPSAADLEAYNAMAVIYEDVPVAESRVARLNRLAVEHMLQPDADGIGEWLIWFRWLVINKRPQLTLMDNRPKVGPLPFNPGSVRVQRVYQQRQLDLRYRLELAAVGIETHVFEILPGVQVAASDTPCAYAAGGLLCSKTIEDGIHYRVEVKQSAYDAAVRRAETVARETNTPVADVEFIDDITDRGKLDTGTHGDIGAIPDSHIEWVHQPVLDPNTGRQLYQWNDKAGRVTPVTKRVAVNVSIPRSHMSSEPMALGRYETGRDGRARLVEAIDLPISNPAGRGRTFTATVIDLDGHKREQVQRFDWQGPVLATPFSEYDERRAGDELPNGQMESGFDDWAKEDQARWLVQQAAIRRRNPDFRDRLRRRLAERASS